MTARYVKVLGPFNHLHDRIRFVLALLASFSLHAALHSTAYADDKLGQAWPELIHQLQAKGVHQIGGLNLAQLVEQGKTVTWVVNSQPPPSVVSGPRQSAFFDIANKTVYLSKNRDPGDQNSHPQLELHETLGALKFNDTNYTLSNALNIINKLPTSQERNRMIQIYGRSLFNAAHLADGGSSVGGGGDLATLVIKNRVIDQLIAQQTPDRKLTAEFLADYPLIAFEPIYDPRVNFVALHYQYSRSEQSANWKNWVQFSDVHLKRGFKELITIYVPMHVWLSEPSFRQALLDDLARKVTELIPAYVGQALEEFTPRGCDALVKFKAPKPTEQSVYDIQQARGAAIKDCGAKDSLAQNITGTGVISPALPEEVMPLSPGLFNFHCTYFEDGKLYAEFREHSRLGTSISLTSQAYIDEKTMFMGDLVVDELGQIKKTIIFIEPEGAKRPEDIETRLAQSPVNASIYTTYRGHKLLFSCTRY